MIRSDSNDGYALGCRVRSEAVPWKWIGIVNPSQDAPEVNTLSNQE